MQKILSFLRSMKFGMILLVVILLLSLPGSLIPQGYEAMWYVKNYPSLHPVILALGLQHIFSTWYFITLVVLLCGNLTLCSLIRIGSIRRQTDNQIQTAAASPVQITLPAEQREKLISYLKAAHYKPHQPVEQESTGQENIIIWSKHKSGFYGSFLTHLGILLVFVTGGAVLYFSDVQDYTILPGEVLTLSDGTNLSVDDFHIEDETGRLDYASHVTITAPDGTTDPHAELRVNHPHSFQGRKYYQQTYGTCGSVSVQDGQGGQDTFSLTEPCLLSADGKTGIWFEALYPGYIQDRNGNYTLISSTAGAYTNPVYQVIVYGTEGHTPVLAFPGEHITIEEFTYTFHEPIAYPGIRVKTLSPVWLMCLYTAFIILIFGLWLCFFHIPAAIAVRENSYAISTRRNTGLALELAAVLGKEYAPLPEKVQKSEKAKPQNTDEERNLS